MKCNKCDHKLPDDSEFCQYCGSKIENYEIHQEESAEEITKEVFVSDETAEIFESDLPGLENATPKDVLNAIIKIQAEETVKNLKENSKNQPNNEEDADFGLVPEKPIYTLALMSVDGELEYLNKLYTENGVKVKWNRLGSTSVDGVNGLIDIYDTYLPSGEPYKTIYINMYGAKRSEKAPAGFILNNVESKEKQKKRKKEKKGKTKYCSRCGSVIDNNTKVCTGCGKKYFRGIRFNKFSVIIFLLVVSVILNVVQLIDRNVIDERSLYWMNESVRLQTKLRFYDYNAVIVPNDNSKTYHKYGCSELDELARFWILNTEAAESRGYEKCNICQ